MFPRQKKRTEEKFQENIGFNPPWVFLTTFALGLLRAKNPFPTTPAGIFSGPSLPCECNRVRRMCLDLVAYLTRVLELYDTNPVISACVSIGTLSNKPLKFKRS